MKFRVLVEITTTGYVEVESDTVPEAFQKAHDMNNAGQLKKEILSDTNTTAEVLDEYPIFGESGSEWEEIQDY